jgi:para-aminobenzoate synthetase component 1
VKDGFVVFSPEIFVKIHGGHIYSYPMKGTIDASIPNASAVILNDEKESAEHATIVDLIRNDISMVADRVHVSKYRYLDEIETNDGTLLQVSSEIKGRLAEDWNRHVGDIMFSLLPAGSISGAPKKKTLEIISNSESYDRGFYTGVMGLFDGENLDSAVMIRFVENVGGGLVFKSGGGITSRSDMKMEYEEMKRKVYVPFDVFGND